MSGAFECFHCGSRSVIWDCDYDFEDFGYEGEGIVQILHCANCGAEIEYRIYIGPREDQDDTCKVENRPVDERNGSERGNYMAGDKNGLEDESGTYTVRVKE